MSTETQIVMKHRIGEGPAEAIKDDAASFRRGIGENKVLHCCIVCVLFMLFCACLKLPAMLPCHLVKCLSYDAVITNAGKNKPIFWVELSYLLDLSPGSQTDFLQNL